MVLDFPAGVWEIRRVLAHIAGMPVEETALSAPSGGLSDHRPLWARLKTAAR
jgi:hypothetical protein